MLERYLCGIQVEHVIAIMTIVLAINKPIISHQYAYDENQEDIYPSVQLLARMLGINWSKWALIRICNAEARAFPTFGVV